MNDTTESKDGVKAIYGAISAIMAELPAIGKGQKNKEQGYSFRGIDDLYNAIEPLLARHKVFTVPEAMDMQREERTTSRGTVMMSVLLRMKYHFISGVDGSEVVAITIGEGKDSADKATNKAMAAAHKYAVLQTFFVPTKESADDDPDRTTPEDVLPRGYQERQQPRQQAASQKGEYPAASGQKSPQAAAQPQQQAAQQNDRIENPGSCVIHFGKNKGTALQDLEENSLRWYAFTWNPDEGRRPATDEDYNLLDCARAYAEELGLDANPF
jgi:hypothetical protein